MPDVCFHSLRHSSITYKLKWSGGDIKAVQGDSGHARADMVTEQYSHILDEDRVANARRVDEQVYNQQPQQTQSDSNNGIRQSYSDSFSQIQKWAKRFRLFSSSIIITHKSYI